MLLIKQIGVMRLLSLSNNALGTQKTNLPLGIGPYVL